MGRFPSIKDAYDPNPYLMVCDLRLQGLEKRILAEAGDAPAVVYEMKKQVDSFREKLEVRTKYSVTLELLKKKGNMELIHMVIRMGYTFFLFIERSLVLIRKRNISNQSEEEISGME